MEEKYRRLTLKSQRLFNRAKEIMPGGVLGHARYYKPYPIYMVGGKGSKIWDVDGNEYIDFLMGFAALILGHRYPEVEEAVLEQAKRGIMLGTAFEKDVELAELLVKHNDSLEWVRMANSGGEAVMYALRVARAYTGRPLIAKFEGGYHGGIDEVLISLLPFLDRAGSIDRPLPQPYSKGLYPGVEDNVLVLPFNDIGATEELLRKNSHRVAGVIVEPMQGYAGSIPADGEFLRRLRKVTKEEGILLIFDEIITGFRLGLGGGEEFYGVKPDLKTLGKIIGGGSPIGAYGGSRDMMEIVTPTKDLEADVKRVFQSGTFNVSPFSVVGGIATLLTLERESDKVYSKLNRLGERARKGIRDVLKDRGFEVQTTGLGSIVSIHFTDREIRNVRDVMAAEGKLVMNLYLALMTKGIFNLPPVHMNISAVHTEEEVDRLIEMVQDSAKDIR
jgi:glutamate-1-semialdehyde 2,1-aminomutase